MLLRVNLCLLGVALSVAAEEASVLLVLAVRVPRHCVLLEVPAGVGEAGGDWLEGHHGQGRVFSFLNLESQAKALVLSQRAALPPARGESREAGTGDLSPWAPLPRVPQSQHWTSSGSPQREASFPRRVRRTAVKAAFAARRRPMCAVGFRPEEGTGVGALAAAERGGVAVGVVRWLWRGSIRQPWALGELRRPEFFPSTEPRRPATPPQGSTAGTAPAAPLPPLFSAVCASRWASPARSARLCCGKRTEGTHSLSHRVLN
nr:uncharacterized protein LOC102119794 [Macaca fascicularis]